MTVVHGYCSVDDVREHLGDTGGKLSGPVIERAINAASRAIDRYCGRRFWQDAATSVRTYVPDDPGLCYVDDVSTASGLILKTDDGLSGSFTSTWTSVNYQLEPLNQDVVAAGDTGTAYAWWKIRAIGSLSFPYSAFGRASVQVTARYGWSAVPDDVAQACIIKSVGLFRRKDAPFGVAGFDQFGAVRINRQDPDVVDLLAAYTFSGA